MLVNVEERTLRDGTHCTLLQELGIAFLQAGTRAVWRVRVPADIMLATLSSSDNTPLENWLRDDERHLR